MQGIIKRIVRAIFAEEFLIAAAKAESWREVIALCHRRAYGSR
jgi:hypothetical protein